MMREAIPRSAMALALALGFACRSSPDHFSRLQDAIISEGYALKENAELAPTDWEKAQFDLLKKRCVRVKSIRPIPGAANTYNRFTLIEESYKSEAQAAARMNRFQERPPNWLAYSIEYEDEYVFTLREGFQFKKQVFVLTTDGAIFEPELHRLARQLKNVTGDASRPSHN